MVLKDYLLQCTDNICKLIILLPLLTATYLHNTQTLPCFDIEFTLVKLTFLNRNKDFQKMQPSKECIFPSLR